MTSFRPDLYHTKSNMFRLKKKSPIVSDIALLLFTQTLTLIGTSLVYKRSSLTGDVRRTAFFTKKVIHLLMIFHQNIWIDPMPTTLQLGKLKFDRNLSPIKHSKHKNCINCNINWGAFKWVSNALKWVDLLRTYFKNDYFFCIKLKEKSPTILFDDYFGRCYC